MKAPLDMSNVHLSIVVIGKNEGDRLVHCLNSILKANKPKDWELIYVDSASSDLSPLVAAQMGAQVFSMPKNRTTAAAARNMGWKHAKGNYILFLDGDTLLEPDFLSHALPLFSDPHVAIVCGQRREISPKTSLYQAVLDLDWIGPVGEVLYCGGDALITRSALEEVGGYDPELIGGEEPEMCRRLREKNYKILRINHRMTWHDLSITRLTQYWRRSFRTGYAYAEVASRYWNTKDPLWKKESLHNVGKFSIIILAILCSFFFPYLTGLFVGIFLLLILRSALKIRRLRSCSSKICFFYGIHSHIQHIPIFLGQLFYWVHKLSQSRSSLIEYK